MTIKVGITNLGNCAGDVLEIHRGGEERTDESRLASLRRGETYTLSSTEGELLYQAKHEGRFVGHPTLVAVDPPRTIETSGD